MTTNDIGVSLRGSDAVMQWFGGWPSFHDAEIISLNLARTGQSVLRVYPYYPGKPATVDFIFEEITDVELADFSGQNVIFSLGIEEVIDQTKEKAIRVTLSPCYGLAGRIDAKRLRVELLPGKSPDGGSLW
jgi:Immunity protein 50